ncbi:unnamed protein product [Adineta steineri]|uniref:Large ribosomal subunit protein eL24 n=1 Tax=Adineta steineri TaxID=433720 RepID=A0A814H4K1_9BILA|nr:unnamed protein product [Adineta steineri]CAF1437992.1 unnamed protein product [Adineta steineri]
MFNKQQKKSTAIILNQISSWKVRPIYGFEKQLFPNLLTSFNDSIIPLKYKRTVKIDPARFIYPRDAMGNMLVPLSNRNTFIPFYLPKYDSIKTRSPVWTIKNVQHSKAIIRHIGPMTYDSVNDKSQLSCQTGWTQIGRRALNIHSGFTVPFYDTRKYKQVGDSYSVCFILIYIFYILRLHRFNRAVMKLEICNYSGYKIYPGHGKRAVKTDGKIHIYLSSKCQRAADMRRNPRRVTWTVYYRRKHRKGAAEQEVKKRTRRNIKFQRAITGVTWNEILAKRNQQPEFRKAQRQDAINAAKQAKKVKAQQKKVAQPSGLKSAKPAKKPEKIQKNVPKAGPKKGTQR